MRNNRKERANVEHAQDLSLHSPIGLYSMGDEILCGLYILLCASTDSVTLLGCRALALIPCRCHENALYGDALTVLVDIYLVGFAI